MRRRMASLLSIEGAAVGAALILLIVVFSILSPYFLSGGNIRNLLVTTVFVVLVAAGMTYVLIAGGIDLSVGSVLGLSAGTTLFVLMKGQPLAVGILAGLATGTLAGLINAIFITGLGINDFIMTLAMLSIAGGLLQVLTGKVQLTGVKNSYFNDLSNGIILGIPTPVIIATVVVLVLEFVLLRTFLGRMIFAAGINPRSAHLAGISVRRTRFAVFVLSGLLAGATGVLLASHLNSVQPGLGTGYELTAIAAAVVGGVSLAGGRGSVWRAVIGALFLGVLADGFNILGVDPLWFTIVTGASIIVAVSLDRAALRLASRWLVGGGAETGGDATRPSRPTAPVAGK